MKAYNNTQPLFVSLKSPAVDNSEGKKCVLGLYSATTFLFVWVFFKHNPAMLIQKLHLNSHTLRQPVQKEA